LIVVTQPGIGLLALVYMKALELQLSHRIGATARLRLFNHLII
jgi:hypothetical protein